MVTGVFHTYYLNTVNHLIVNGVYRFPNYEKEYMADVTGQQRKLTPQLHPILILIL